MPLLIVSFIAGVLTILAPCILPLLPVIVGRSLTDTTLSKRRMLTVVLSLGASVIVFTLLLKATSLLVNVPQDFWRYVSGGIILVFGLVTIFPQIWERIKLTSFVNRKGNEVLAKGYQKQSFWGDVIVGASLGMIYLLTYCVGLCLALTVVAILGQKVLAKLNFATDTRGWFKKTLGIIFILVALGILTGYDKKLQISLLDAGFFDVTKVEQGLLDANNKTDPEDELPSLSLESFLTTEGKKGKFP